MTTNAQTLMGLYAKHSGVIRAGLFTLIMMGILAWILIGNAVPANADVIDPVKPDSTALGPLGAVLARLFGALLYAIMALAIGVALVLTIYWLILLGSKNEKASSASPLKRILICLAIAGVMGSGGTAIYMATADVLGGFLTFA